MNEPRPLDERFRSRPEAGGGGPAAYQKWRLMKLAETIEYAVANSPWYQQRTDVRAANDAAARLKDLALQADGMAEHEAAAAASETLNSLPAPTAADLAADSDSFLAVSQGQVEGVVSVPSSGTSGPAKRLYSTAEDLEETVRFFEYGMGYLVRPHQGDRVALAMSQVRRGNVADLLGRAMARLSIPFRAFGFKPPGDDDLWAESVARWRPTCLVGVPSQVFSLMRHPLGPRLAENLRTILLSGDVAGAQLVRQLAAGFGAKVFRHYGLTETGLGGAVECGRRLWPHLRDDLWAEILDDQGRPLPPGRRGQIALTTLTRRAMPLIRYQTGDEGLIAPEPCPCGSMMPRLETFGRLDDRAVLADGRQIRAADFEEALLPLPFVRGFTLKLSGSHLTIAIHPTVNPPDDAPAQAAEKTAQWLGPSAGGLSVNIVIKNEEAPKSGRVTGKRRLRA